jgi:hypothetical protein
MKILVLLASFLDDELPYTIRSCIGNAANPKNIRFSVLLQHDEKTENIIDILPYDIRLAKVDYKVSQGVGWARNIVNQVLTDEEYVLQIDSHTRLAKDWDVKLIEQLDQLGEKAIISFLPPPFTKDKINNVDLKYWYTDTPTLIHVPKPVSIVANWAVDVGGYRNMQDTQMKNIRVPFLFAGFIFGRSQWLRDVPSDPDMYYWGEEQSLCIRSWTRGYDIYLPKENMAWHYSGTEESKASPHHWDVLEEKSAELNNIAFNKLARLMQGQVEGIYGLGTERTVQEWMDFSGVDFINKKFNERNFNG